MEVPILVLVGFVGPLFLVGFVVYWWATHVGRNRIADIWAAYARRRGFEFVPAEGEWPNRSAPAVRWREGQAEYRIEARGTEAFVSTAVVAELAKPMDGELVLRRATAADAGSERTGDPLLDARYAIRAEPRDLAPRLLTEDVKRALVGFDVGAGGSLAYQRGQVKLSWSGAEENDARLDEARGVVRRVLQALEPVVIGAASAVPPQ